MPFGITSAVLDRSLGGCVQIHDFGEVCAPEGDEVTAWDARQSLMTLL